MIQETILKMHPTGVPKFKKPKPKYIQRSEQSLTSLCDLADMGISFWAISGGGGLGLPRPLKKEHQKKVPQNRIK